MKLKRPGDKWQNKTLPVNFMAEYNITSRVHYGETQYKTTEITSALKKLKKPDTFCILGVTNKDLYPDDSYNFVFG